MTRLSRTSKRRVGRQMNSVAFRRSLLKVSGAQAGDIGFSARRPAKRKRAPTRGSHVSRGSSQISMPTLGNGVGCGQHIFATRFEPHATEGKTWSWSQRKKVLQPVSPNTVSPSSRHDKLASGSAGRASKASCRRSMQNSGTTPAPGSEAPQFTQWACVGHVYTGSGSICTAHQDLAGHAAQLRSGLNRSAVSSKHTAHAKNRPPHTLCVVPTRARSASWRRLPTAAAGASIPSKPAETPEFCPSTPTTPLPIQQQFRSNVPLTLKTPSNTARSNTAGRTRPGTSVNEGEPA